MTISTETTSLNLNQAFHRYNSLGMARRLKARARVSLIQFPKRGIRVVLLLDYTTSAWDPRMAPGQAIAAEFLFDNMSERQYMAHVCAAKAKFGSSTDKQGDAAQMEALRLLIESPNAVCVFRDENVLKIIAQPLPDGLVQVPADVIARINICTPYDEQTTLAGTLGPITADAVAQQVRATLAVGFTCFTEARFVWESEAGEHPNWTLARARAA